MYYEQPLQTAMLLSMTGVGSLLANQWYTSVEANLERTNTVIKGIERHSVSLTKHSMYLIGRIIVGEQNGW